MIEFGTEEWLNAEMRKEPEDRDGRVGEVMDRLAFPEDYGGEPLPHPYEWARKLSQPPDRIRE